MYQKRHCIIKFRKVKKVEQAFTEMNYGSNNKTSIFIAFTSFSLFHTDLASPEGFG